LTTAEFKTIMGYRPRQNQYLRSQNKPHGLHHMAVADSLDWRTKAAVTPIKDQGQCGSCWAFSTTGSVEGAHAIASGSLVSLSEQQLMDCSTPEGNMGCDGGLMDDAFEYILLNKGITGEKDDPYLANSGKCPGTAPVRATISGFKDIPVGDEKALMAAVNLGPVSIAIEADQFVFQFYSGGVLDSAACGTNLDHGVLVVGYGTDSASSKPYWIVKNSWGTSWGESGYVRLVRDKNQCGLSDAASYPTV